VEPAVAAAAQSLSIRGVLLIQVPRPGIEPGLEVPETSVMSFSLPGRPGRRHQYITVMAGTSEPGNLAGDPDLQTDALSKSTREGA
jgi:hypothetical protein